MKGKKSAEGVSLNKYISNTGYCSRREADTIIAMGQVTINGIECKKGNRVQIGDVVKVYGKKVKPSRSKPIYIALHKPKRIVCTTDANEPNNIVRYVNHKQRLFPIGRLDKLSSGLILLTNDGDMVNKILRAGNQHEKEYMVTVEEPISTEFVAKMAKGVAILGTRTKPCKVLQLNEFAFKITLIQGLNRQIRRMCESLGYTVKKLSRIRIMHLKLGKIKYGEWRLLSDEEVAELKELTKRSSKTQV